MNRGESQKEERNQVRWLKLRKGEDGALSLSFLQLQAPLFSASRHFTRNGLWVASQIIQERKAACTDIHPFSLPPPLHTHTYTHTPSSVLRIHLQIEQIYHSVRRAVECLGAGMQQGRLPCSPDSYPLCLFTSCCHDPCCRPAGLSPKQPDLWSTAPPPPGQHQPPITCLALGTCCCRFILKNPKVFQENIASIFGASAPANLLLGWLETGDRTFFAQSHRLHVNSRRPVFQSVQTNMAKWLHVHVSLPCFEAI